MLRTEKKVFGLLLIYYFCLWNKYIFPPFLCIAVVFPHSCLPVLPDEGLCYVFTTPKQFLGVFCILWCYFFKWYSIILQNTICSAPLSYIMQYEWNFAEYFYHFIFRLKLIKQVLISYPWIKHYRYLNALRQSQKTTFKGK